MKLVLYSNGVFVGRPGKAFAGVNGRVGGVRGSVLGFSLASRRRLRRWLLSKCVAGCTMYGVTLTVPRPDDMSNVCDKFRNVFHRFRVSWVRCFPRCGFVWRVELQRSRVPHLHLISYHDSPVSSSDYLGLWFSSLSTDFLIPSLSAFARRGVLVELLDGSINSYRYICDHGSKAKQDQLGWIGRQWGIIGKGLFSDRLGSTFDIPDFLEIPFNRFLSKVCRFRVKSDCVFGSRLSRGRKKFSVAYLNENAVRRWLVFNGLKINSFHIPSH